MTDDSKLDKKYFIDEYVYNCPFCNRRNVNYSIVDEVIFDWSESKKCYCFKIECASCKKDSFHFSLERIDTVELISGYTFPKRFVLKRDDKSVIDLDESFFISIPSSFFVIDERIPKIIRELFFEAEGCLKNNFLTGASACIRKIIYELTRLQAGDGNDYETRIKSLKSKLPSIDDTFFDTLVTIQEITSEKVHEDSYDSWSSMHVRAILSTIDEILKEIYVIPNQRKESREKILKLKQTIKNRDEKKT